MKTSWFELVDTKKKNELFDEKWTKICEENNFIYVSKPFEELNASGIVRYLIKDAQENFIGTVEFVPFTPGGYSVIQHYADFHGVKKYIENQQYVYEISKLSIDQERRSEGHLEKILSLLADFSKNYEAKYFIASMNSKLFDTLTRFGIRLEQTFDTLVYDTYSLVPCEFNIENLERDLKTSRWYKRQQRNLLKI